MGVHLLEHFEGASSALHAIEASLPNFADQIGIRARLLFDAARVAPNAVNKQVAINAAKNAFAFSGQMRYQGLLEWLENVG